MVAIFCLIKLADEEIVRFSSLKTILIRYATVQDQLTRLNYRSGMFVFRAAEF